MRYYELGVMDLYPMAVSGTEIEDSPTLEIQLDENIDGKRLEEVI